MGWADSLGNKVQVNLKNWQKAMEDQKRVGVIGSDCCLDNLLESILNMSFVRRDKEVMMQFDPEKGGSLVGLTNKARLVYALGLIDKTTLDDLKQIHKIRNRFAHNVNINFTDAEVCKKVSRLSIIKDSKVTTEDNYGIYLWTVNKCLKAIAAGIQRNIRRTAVLKKLEK